MGCVGDESRFLFGGNADARVHTKGCRIRKVRENRMVVP